MKRTLIIFGSLLLFAALFLAGCGSPAASTPASTNPPGATVPAATSPAANAPKPSSTPAASPTPSLSLPPTTTTSAPTEASGYPLKDVKDLYGSWAFIERVSKISGGFSRTTTYDPAKPDTDIYYFDQIYVTISHNGATNFRAEYTFKDGVLTMTEKAANSRPIVYTNLQLKDGILTAVYKDRDITENLKWQKVNK
jgi:hypothetical protein